MLHEEPEAPLVDRGELAVRLGGGGRGAVLPVYQRQLAEYGAGACLLEHPAVLDQGHAAALHHVHPVGAVALGEDRLARLEGLGVSGPLQQNDEPSCVVSVSAMGP